MTANHPAAAQPRATPDLDALREKAERALNPWYVKGERISPTEGGKTAAFIVACSPERILALLDERAALLDRVTRVEEERDKVARHNATMSYDLHEAEQSIVAAREQLARVEKERGEVLRQAQLSHSVAETMHAENSSLRQQLAALRSKVERGEQDRDEIKADRERSHRIMASVAATLQLGIEGTITRDRAYADAFSELFGHLYGPGEAVRILAEGARNDL